MKQLNERQWALYRYLEGRGDQWTHQEDIAYALPMWYAPTTSGDFHNTTQRNDMTKDIRAINDSTEIQKVIISNPSRGIKIATEAEWEEAIRREYISVFNRLKRVRHKEKKGLLNGQTRLVFETEQEVIEAFLQHA